MAPVCARNIGTKLNLSVAAGFVVELWVEQKKFCWRVHFAREGNLSHVRDNDTILLHKGSSEIVKLIAE